MDIKTRTLQSLRYRFTQLQSRGFKKFNIKKVLGLTDSEYNNLRCRPKGKNSTEYYRAYIRERRRRDPGFRIKGLLQTRIRTLLQGQVKADHCSVLMGCTIAELIKHLENQFDARMNWGNHGQFGWHVDHIKPCASFDLSNPEEQRKCFHYTNLRPLWWSENIKKGCRILT